MTTLLINIKELIQVREENVKKVSGNEMKELPTLKNAFLAIKDEKIIDFGLMEDIPSYSAAILIDCKGKMVFPTWCDSHTHIVYAGTREQEFVDRINGLTYEEIAKNGGGILNSAKRLRESSEQELYELTKVRLDEVMRLGTGAIEIKSGYGLTTDAELKMLRVVKRLRDEFDLPIKATFLGAHAFPEEFKENQEAYIDVIINEMLPKVASENLAEFVDVFCETGYFTVEQTEKIIQAAKKVGLQPKVHVNQFTTIGGVEKCVSNDALSVDHLEVLSDDDIKALQGSGTMPVALPSCSYFLSIPYTPARQIIDSNLPLALASDYNPGSTPSGNMNFVVATACIKMKMTPEEAINAATINGAYAMNLSDEVGSITKGKKANFFITKEISSYNFLPYNFGSSVIESVYINGKLV
ncbi:imidazolonepropionase [uncultured Tenacibaculum sp.]|uniref:imidazolonepropionase n=1 Tax=uncultured Tenacibaculum sp. TaxID=174713 RepID=UPI0026234F7B|nr:imidazolonepropionase [uncultured Tenacibaculum sp.]